MYEEYAILETYRGFEIKCEREEDYENPREFSEPLGSMICFHRRYSLGDKHYMDIDELKEIVAMPDTIALPLYLYDHGGITMRTSSFSCLWDSGQVGFIYVTHEELRHEFQVRRVSPKLQATARRILETEVEEYDMYLRGDVFHVFVEDDDGEMIDSCGWIYGGPEHVLPEFRAAIDRHIQDKRKERWTRMKELIRNSVPLNLRQRILAEYTI